MKKINLLDCTLRDGGYYNDWDFDPQLISAYIKAMTALPADILEIGFRSMPGAGGKFKGGNAYCTDEYIRSLDLPVGRFEIGVMINGVDLLEYPEGLNAGVDRLFGPSENSPVQIVRVACHVHQVKETLPAMTRLHELGYRTTIQLMQIAGISREEIVSLAMDCSRYPIDVVYFADSLGGMVPDDINRTVEALRTHWNGEIGFHAHNNMDGAVANSIRAIEQGVTWIDGTVAGMGRGPGNARTEYLAIELETKYGRKLNQAPLLDLIYQYFKPMQQQYGWGPNPYYYMAGKFGIHPTYVQTMLDDTRYQSEDILAVIHHLNKIGGKHYNYSNLETGRLFYCGPANGQWDPAELVQDKTVIILGAGPGAKKHKLALEKYIKRYSPVVIALNKQTPLDQDLIDVRAACHPIRLVADHEDHLNLPQPLITPFSMIPEDVSSLYQGKEILDYGLTIQENTFEFHHHYSVVPNALVVAYVLALIASGKAKHICLAGFDGYDPGDQRMIEMDKVFALYMSHENSVPLTSITPSKYRVPQVSIYEICAR